MTDQSATQSASIHAPWNFLVMLFSMRTWVLIIKSSMPKRFKPSFKFSYQQILNQFSMTQTLRMVLNMRMKIWEWPKKKRWLAKTPRSGGGRRTPKWRTLLTSELGSSSTGRTCNPINELMLASGPLSTWMVNLLFITYFIDDVQCMDKPWHFYRGMLLMLIDLTRINIKMSTIQTQWSSLYA